MAAGYLFRFSQSVGVQASPGSQNLHAHKPALCVKVQDEHAVGFDRIDRDALGYAPGTDIVGEVDVGSICLSVVGNSHSPIVAIGSGNRHT